MTPPEIAAAYARIEKVWRSATRQSKQIYLVQPAQLDTAAAADLDLEQPEVRDLIRGIRMLEGARSKSRYLSKSSRSLVDRPTHAQKGPNPPARRRS